MRALKIAGIVLACLIGLVVLGVAALLLLVNPNDYRDNIERLVLDKTGRSLQIGGKLDLKMFPWLALSISDVRLGNPPGYGNEPFAAVKQVSVGVKLLPLLHKRVEVSRISVDGVTANLVSRSATENNWKDLGNSQGKSPPPETQSGPTPQGSIEGFELTNSTFSFRDEAKKSSTVLSNLDIKAGAVGTGAPVPITVAFDYASLSPAQSGLSPAHSGSSSPTHVSLSSPGVSFDPAAGTLAPAQFSIKFGDLALELTAAGEKLLTDRVLTGKVTVPQISLRKLLDTYGGGAPVTRDPKALSAFTLGADYRLTQKQLKLTNLLLALDDTHMRGSAGVDDLDSMALGYDLKVDTINADRYRAPVPAQPAAKPSPADAKRKPPTPLPIETLRKLNLHGTLQVGSATLSGITLTGVTLPVTANDGRLHLGPTRASTLGGTYNGDILLDARGQEAHLTTNEHAKGIDVGALAKALLDTTRLSGHGDANIVVAGVGNTDADIMRSLGGKIDVNVKDGALNGIDLWFEERRAYALIKQTAVPERPQPVRTAFNTLSATANLDKGVAHTDDLTVATDFLKLRGKGTFDLTTQAVDYQIVVSLSKVPPPGSAGSELASLQSTDVPFTIRGTVDNLTVRPDIQSLAKAQVRQKVNEELDKHKDEIKQKLGDKLKGLFGR